MDHAPSGSVTFLFTDIEGSTRLWEEHPDAMPAIITRHDELLRQAIESHRGFVFKTVGDAFCAAFADPPDALAAAVDGQRALVGEFPAAGAPDAHGEPEIGLRVRMALHSGIAEPRSGDYFGRPVNRVARLLSIAHGGQIIVSGAAQAGIGGELPVGVTLADKGFHRLKDLLEAEAVHQVCHADLPDGFPPLLSLQRYRHNLPGQLTSFIGRDREMADVQEVIGRARLVTLVGSGGTGKTRLALQTATEQIDRYPDGVWLAELAALSDPAFVPHAVAAALEVREQPGRAVTDSLAAALRGKNLLLVLDNCEHLADAAARLCDTLLRTCPNVRILATSREILQVYGEFTYRVPSLDMPVQRRRTTLAETAACASVQLFVDRAVAASSRFELTAENHEAVAHICRTLDGIPLAIELASATVRALTVNQIADRLSNRFALLTRGARTALPRQQTLRALIDWSWDLLTVPERILLRRLSVFAGGWSLETAENVCAGECDDPEFDRIESVMVLDLISQLVDKSLVQTEEGPAGPRFRLMETIRSYAAERLQQADESPELCERHLAWFQRLALDAEGQLDGPATQHWLDRLETEHDNIRAALGFAGVTEDGLRLASAVHRFWLVRGYLTEGRECLERALKATDIQDVSLRARALNRAGILAWKQGDFTAAKPLIASSLEIWNERADRLGAAGALNNLGLVADDEGDPASARIYYEQAAAIYREIGDRPRTGMVLANLGVNLLDQEELEAARTTFDEWLGIAEEANDPWCMATARHNLAEVAYRRRDIEQSVRLCKESLVMVEEVGDAAQVMQLLLLSGQLSLEQGDPARAIRLLAASESMRTSDGLYLSPSEDSDHKSAVARSRGLVNEAEFDRQWTAGHELSPHQAIRLALDCQASGH